MATLRRWLAHGFTAIATSYWLTIFGWLGLHIAFGDRWWWLFLLNSFVLYLFVPLVVLLPLALLVRRWLVWISLGSVLALGAYLYGGLLLPKFQDTPQAGVVLTVMSTNELGSNNQTEHTIAALQFSDADVIGIQELNPDLADAIERDLADAYPYQVLQSAPGVSGLGVISRFPLQATGETLEGTWLGAPQILAIDVRGQPVTFVNFHAIPPAGGLRNLGPATRERERQATALRSFAEQRDTPLIAVGDLNATDQHVAHAIITEALIDTWRATGWGFGHTFPGSSVVGRPRFRGLPIPRWLVRIDYVFCSPDWQPLDATIGPWDGFSDHRPVLARLVLPTVGS